MKKMKLIFALLLIVCSTAGFSQSNIIVFTPLTQSVSVSSGQLIEVEVRAQRLGNASTSESFRIETRDIPDNGFISSSPNSGNLASGTHSIIKFKFRRTVSNTTTTRYRFWGIHNGNPGTYSAIDITVTYNLNSDCYNSYPRNLSVTNITSSSAKLTWTEPSVSYGLQYQFKRSPYYNWTGPIQVGPSPFTLSNLESSTSYDFRIRNTCAGGAYSIWSPRVTFTTLPDCPTDLTIDQDVGQGQTDNQEAQNTIALENQIESGGTANYDAGTRVSLKPGFHAKSGAVFRAYIDGCTPSSSISNNDGNISFSNEIAIEEVEESDIKIYPNPVKDYFIVESKETIISYRIFNHYGNQVLTKNVNATKSEVQMDGLPNGLYLLELKTKKGKIVKKKIVKD